MRINTKPDVSLCPVYLLSKYLKIRGSKPGPLFVHKNGIGVPYNKFASKLKQYIGKAGLNPKYYGTHSFRIGRCTDLVQDGFSAAQIKSIGRWHSYAYRKYIRPKIVQL